MIENTMAGKSPAFMAMLDNIQKVAACSASVLLLGESGSGKELAAQAIHAGSKRSDKPLVTLECAGLPDALFESELFGHVKGAFTGAQHNKKGLVELADGGTLFLDEIGDVPLTMQVKLLRLLETGTYRMVGSAQVKKANFRLVCATHLDIKTMVADGRFRQDLFYRINVFPIKIPPLRERKADIGDICQVLVAQMNTLRPMEFTASAFTRLQQYHFPGNIRELRNLLARAVVLSESNIIDGELIEKAFAIDAEPQQDSHELRQDSHELRQDSPELRQDSPELRLNSHKLRQDSPEPELNSRNEKWTDLKTAEQDYLQRMMAAFDNDKKRVAEIAGISERSLYRKLQGAE